MSEEGKRPRIQVRAAGLFRRDDKILFVIHQKNNRKVHLLPGGNVQYGESMHLALRREFFEELSVQIEIGNFIQAGESISPQGQKHLLQFIFQVQLDPASLKLGIDPAVIGFTFLDKKEIQENLIFPDAKSCLLSCLDREKNELFFQEYLWQS